jgi:hypothetical protein
MTLLELQLRELVERGGMYASTHDLAVLYGASDASVLRVMHKLHKEGLEAASGGRLEIIEGEAGRTRGRDAKGRQPKIYYWATM